MLDWLAACLLIGSGTALWFALRSFSLEAQALTAPLHNPLALGPLVHFYVRSRLAQPVGRPLLHMAPAAAALAYHLILFLMPASAFAVWKEDSHDHLVKPALDYLILASLVAYAAASIQLAAASSPGRPSEAAPAARRIGWALAGCALLLSLLRLFNWFVAEVPDSHSYWIYLLLAGAPLGFWFLDRPVRTAIRKAGLDSAEELERAGLRWKRAILDQGWWREPDLTLQKAARRLGTNSHYLSRALNQGVGQSFPDLINRARARQVARRLGSAGSAERLLDLAYEAGFSSKATFNRAFRSAFGCAPSAYVSFHEKECAEEE